MPASGGSLSDTNVSTNKVVDGQSHYLAYITPDEGKSLMDQGGKEVVTDQGIPAYPPPGERGGPGSGSEGRAPTGEGRGEYQSPSSSRQPGLETSTSVAKQKALQEDIRNQQTETKDSLITKVKNKIISKTDALKIASKLGWVTDNAFVNAIGGAWGIAMGMGSKVQQKAITWDLNKRLEKEYKIEDDPRYRTGKSDIIQDKLTRAELPSDHPDHYGQTEYMEDYPGQEPASDRGQGDNARGLTNIITPYAAHAIGGTTQQTSQAAQWYANLGSGNSNPGAFDLTAQYAKAKAAVSQKLQSTSSVGQIAVADSAFFNFLKDNSLNKGIL